MSHVSGELLICREFREWIDERGVKEIHADSRFSLIGSDTNSVSDRPPGWEKGSLVHCRYIIHPEVCVCVLESKQETKKEKSTNVFQSDKHVIYCCWCDFCPHPNSTSRLFPETSPLCSSVPHLISSFPVKTQPAYWFHPTVNTGSHPIAGSRLHGGEMHGWDSRINLISALR